MELAIIAVPFFMFFLFLFELSFDQYSQAALNFAVAQAAYQVQIGNAQGAAGSSGFVQNYVCPAANGLLSCADITVNVQVLPANSDYYTYAGATVVKNGKLDTSGFTYCPGGPGTLMLLQAIYSGPSIVGGFLPGWAISNGAALVHSVESRVAFVNEGFDQTAATPAGC